jgi:putative ABC transport system permease protein
MRQTLDRGQKFLNLVALLAALLAAVAVGIAARDFASRHLDDCAMLRVLGHAAAAHRRAYRWSSACVGLDRQRGRRGAGLRGALRLRLAARRPARRALPPATAWPALFGLGVGMTLLVAFGLPPVLQLARVPPLRVIRRDVGALKPASAAVLAPARPALSRC